LSTSAQQTTQEAAARGDASSGDDGRSGSGVAIGIGVAVGLVAVVIAMVLVVRRRGSKHNSHTLQLPAPSSSSGKKHGAGSTQALQLEMTTRAVSGKSPSGAARMEASFSITQPLPTSGSGVATFV